MGIQPLPWAPVPGCDTAFSEEICPNGQSKTCPGTTCQFRLVLLLATGETNPTWSQLPFQVVVESDEVPLLQPEHPQLPQVLLKGLVLLCLHQLHLSEDARACKRAGI